jgi:hypothetical protein
LKFKRHGEPVSVQLHSTEFIERLCALESVNATVLRATATSRSNDVFGFERHFETPQPHYLVGRGAWLVDIDQDPWLHGDFCTQIYHNMVMGSCTLRDRHGFGDARRQLLRGVALETLQHEQDLHSGLMRLMWRNQEKWSSSARARFFAEVRAALGHDGREQLS